MSAARSKARTLTTEALERVDSAPAAAAALCAVLTERCRRSGVPDALIDFAANERVAGGTRSASATLRILHRVATGDNDALTHLLHRFGESRPEALMWAALDLAGYEVAGLSLTSEPGQIFAALRPEIERGFVTDGYSTTFEWLLANDRLPSDDQSLDELIRLLLDSSFVLRERAEPRPKYGPSLLHGIVDLIGDIGLMLWGPSVLRVVAPGAVYPLVGDAEFATFCTVDEVAAHVAGRTDVTTTGRDQNGVTLRLALPETDLSARIRCLTLSDGDVIASEHGWGFAHSTFTPTVVAIDGHPWPMPGDPERHLDERYGTWRDAPLHHDPMLDSPAAFIERSTAGLFATVHRLNDAVDARDRTTVTALLDRLRDQFGIDATRYIPAPPPRRTLATPISASDVARRDLNVVVGRYDDLDPAVLRSIQSLTDRCDAFHVAAVLGAATDDSLMHRIDTASSLRWFDAVIATDDAAALATTSDLGDFGVRLDISDYASGLVAADGDAGS